MVPLAGIEPLCKHLKNYSNFQERLALLTVLLAHLLFFGEALCRSMCGLPSRSGLDRVIFRRTRMDQRAPAQEVSLLADEQPFVPKSLASVHRTYRHKGSSASLYRLGMIYTDTAAWLSKKVLATGCCWRKAVIGPTTGVS